jgi:hypothetical protein
MKRTNPDTQLVLFEGIFGSGKTTTAAWLASLLNNAGFEAVHHWESDPKHPIHTGLKMSTIIEDYKTFVDPDKTLRYWCDFVSRQIYGSSVYLFDGMFWQRTAELSYLVGANWNDIIASNARIIETIAPLNPCLVAFFHSDVSKLLVQTMKQRPDWTDIILRVYDAQAWLKRRGVYGPEGFLAFKEEWQTMAEDLFDRFPFRKLRVVDPNNDWRAARQQICAFVGLS